MRDISLGKISTIKFNGKILIPIDERWIKYFISDDLKFEVAIKSKKFVLIGPEVVDP